ncbi:MAG: hypothetical protein MPK62_11765, partial [Alphaproteobacteria bacterium]|nr:hypothetical protein [Alphaproteobacteria bacterium]
FIQAFDDISDDSSIKVIYNKGGSPQEIVIRYEADMDDLASFDLDRSKYPHDAHVHVDINDNLLNIDPTDIDVWTFGAGTDDVYYQLFDSAGDLQVASTDAAVATLDVPVATRTSAHFDTSAVLVFDRNNLGTAGSPNHVLRIQDTDNGDHTVATTMNLVTFKESGKNTGLFENTDGNSVADLVTGPEGTGTAGIGRENPFAITYADTAKNWFVGYSTAVLNMDTAAVGSDWGSGEELPVSVTDQDLNKNSLVTDYIRVGSTDPLLSIQLGAEGETVAPLQSNFVVRSLPIDISARPNIDGPDNNGVTSIPSGTTVNGDVIVGAHGSILQDGLAANRALFFEWDVSAFGPGAIVKFWAGGGDYFTGGTGQGGTFLPDSNKGNLRIDNHPLRSTATTFSGDLRFAIEGAVATTEATTITAILRLVNTEGTITTLEETGINTG